VSLDSLNKFILYESFYESNVKYSKRLFSDEMSYFEPGEYTLAKFSKVN
jgi:hypothetical protein